MKRALAERAKQEIETGHGATNGLGPAPVVSSGQPPRKIPRVDNNASSHQQQVKAEPITIPSRAPSSSTPRASPSGTPREKRTSMKRQRSSAALSSEEKEEDDSSAFYLKHQNRALASELKGLQYQLRLLEKERDLRRLQCEQAGQALQALQNTWTQMEVALQHGTPPGGGGVSAETEQPAAESSDSNDDGGARNTGSGSSVELVGSLLDSLKSLGEPAISAPSSNDDDAPMDAAVETQLRDMKQAASMISQRSTVLQKWLWTLLRRVNSSERYESLVERAELEGQVATLKSQCRDLEARITELANTRDEAVASDRRVRRGLYRLAAGRMKLDEVLKAVEDDDKDGAAAIMAMEVANEASNEQPVSSSTAIDAVGGDPEEGEVVDGAQVVSLKKQLQDLQEIANSRESQIEQLLKEREEHSKRINSLSLQKSSDRASISDEDVKRSSLYTNTATKLVTSERQLAELQARMERVMEKYATAKGDAELATKTLEEHMQNFKKRWAELAGAEKEGGDYDDLYDDAEHSSKKENGASLLNSSQQAKRIVELEHKLKQALESVRQADLVRVSLSEAQSMNETLLQQLEDFKAKYAAVMAGRTASRSSSETASKDKSPSAPISAEKAEKLYKENRRMKKELDVALLGKQSAKAKQDKAEKERDDLLETNSRLLKQNMEKDDMNAKSLSTILHLKSLTEQAEKEKEAREQEAKSAEQVALAARLAENARERVAEEALKEKKVLEDRVAELEKECERVKREKEVTDGALAQTKAEMSSLETSVGAIKDRSEELTAESAKLQEEKRKLVESLAVAQREAAEAAKKVIQLRASGGGGGGDSEFTADQLSTQVSVLKGRLACPVCNHRDKACILQRCRHMFCKPCVEENVKNRSRKCPACGQRFDNKDVHDVWL